MPGRYTLPDKGGIGIEFCGRISTKQDVPEKKPDDRNSSTVLNCCCGGLFYSFLLGVGRGGGGLPTSWASIKRTMLPKPIRRSALAVASSDL